MASFNILTGRPECRPVAHLCRPVKCHSKTYFTNKCLSYVIFSIFWGQKIRKDQTFPGAVLGELTVLPDPLVGGRGWLLPSPRTSPPTLCAFGPSGLKLRPFWLRSAVPPSKNSLKEAIRKLFFQSNHFVRNATTSGCRTHPCRKYDIQTCTFDNYHQCRTQHLIARRLATTGRSPASGVYYRE